jgi:hypothetical protein
MAHEMKIEQAVSSVTTTGNYRWAVCALLFFATTINYMDRQILSLLKPILDKWRLSSQGSSGFAGCFSGSRFTTSRRGRNALVGYLMSRGWSVTLARKTSMFIFALCVVPILFVTTVGNWTAVLLIGLAGSAHQAWSASLYSTASDMFPKRAVASLIGLGSTAGSTAGIFFLSWPASC